VSLAALLGKDLRREGRGRQALQAGAVLVALFLVLDLFAFRTLAGQHRAAAAALWAPILYATAALCGRGLAAEADRGTLDLLRSAPVPLALHGLSRTLVDGAVAVALALACALVAGPLLALPVTAALLGVLALGAAGLAVLGSLAAAIAAQARSRDLLLPVLLVPAAAPLLHAGIEATVRVLAGSAAKVPVLLMGGYLLLAAGAALLLWPIVLEGD
jgi:ABC-type transport system involved in cytochrome c biogenesis permease component